VEERTVPTEVRKTGEGDKFIPPKRIHHPDKEKE